VSRLSRQCDILNISQPYRPPRPVTEMALIFTFFTYINIYVTLVHFADAGARRQRLALSIGYNRLGSTYIYYIPWPESANELYRPSDRRLSAKLVPIFADKGCHVLSVKDPYGRNLGLLDRDWVLPEDGNRIQSPKRLMF
jgi:hypothetical protein